MAKKVIKRGILNQIVEEPEEEKNENVAENEAIRINAELLASEPVVDKISEEEKIMATIMEEDVKDLDEKFGIDAEEEIEKIFSEEESVEVHVEVSDPEISEVSEEIAEEIKEEPKPRSLSPKEQKLFARTGILPK